jgi:hypothetical protein
MLGRTMGTGGYIPSDPTTWTDWNAPETRGFVKVDCTTGLEAIFDYGWKGCALISAGILWFGLFGGRGRTATVTDPRVYLGAGILGAAGALFFVLRLLTDNFYLVDPSRHAVYLHAKFLFTRRVRRLLERQDIAGVAIEAQRRRSRYRHWTEHRTVLIGRDGRHVPMSDFRKDGLWDANNLAISLGRQLEVPSYEAPDETRLVVARDQGQLRIGYEPFSWITGIDGSRLLVVGIVVLLGVAAVILGWVK